MNADTATTTKSSQEKGKANGLQHNAAEALHKVSEKILEKAPDTGPIANAAVRVASGVEAASEKIRTTDAKELRAQFKPGLTGMALGGVALIVGAAYFVTSYNRKSPLRRKSERLAQDVLKQVRTLVAQYR